MSETIHRLVVYRPKSGLFICDYWRLAPLRGNWGNTDPPGWRCGACGQALKDITLGAVCGATYTRITSDGPQELICDAVVVEIDVIQSKRWAGFDELIERDRKTRWEQGQ